MDHLSLEKESLIPSRETEVNSLEMFVQPIILHLKCNLSRIFIIVEIILTKHYYHVFVLHCSVIRYGF